MIKGRNCSHCRSSFAPKRSDSRYCSTKCRNNSSNGRRSQTKYHQSRRLDLKLKVLTSYGKDGQLKCCWPDCEVTDVDMLTLDHVNNNGAAHRKTVGDANVYKQAVDNDFPPEYQTLCMNHNLKKQLMLVRERN